MVVLNPFYGKSECGIEMELCDYFPFELIRLIEIREIPAYIVGILSG